MAAASKTGCVFRWRYSTAVRAHWPRHKPISVRISATDWAPGGITPEDGLRIAAAFRGHGADIIDVSAGQTSRWANPVYGRMFQTPFSEMIRNEVRRSDHRGRQHHHGRSGQHHRGCRPRGHLCALARPHLTNPHFTLTASAEYGYDAQFWPLPYLAGKDQAFRLYQRQQVEMAALRLAAKPSSHDQRREIEQAAE